MSHNKRTFCWNCWRDWQDEFLNLAPWEQDQFLHQNPRINPNDYERGRCPFCGSRYDEELSDWLDDLFGDEFWEEERDFDLADWEEDRS